MCSIRYSALIRAVTETALEWRDPDHGPRRNAEAETVRASHACTPEAVVFAVNQQMSLLTQEALEGWIRGRRGSRQCTVGVLHAGNVPMGGLQDVLAVVLTGHGYVGSMSSRSPALLPAFLRGVRRRVPDLAATTAPANTVFSSAEALIATGTGETLGWVRGQCREHGIALSMALLRRPSYAVGVLDGLEDDDAYERLAEDVLLHEGFGCRSVAVVWAPRGHSPDGLLEAMARFRGVFSPHPRTPGRLLMQQAFLEAVDVPHAYGEGLEFLVSRGEAKAQQPGHLRWAEYDDLSEVCAWLFRQREEIQIVVADDRIRPSLIAGCDPGDVGRSSESPAGKGRRSYDPGDVGRLPILALGQAQRPALDWCPDGVDTVSFLTGLGSDEGIRGGGVPCAPANRFVV